MQKDKKQVLNRFKRIAQLMKSARQNQRIWLRITISHIQARHTDLRLIK